MEAANRLLQRLLDVPDSRARARVHTTAANAVHSGAAVRGIAYALGHSDPAVTARVYTHTDPEMMTETVDAAALAMV